MSLSVGIVGLPNVGKSTLFNALLQREIADVAEYPFTTIEPNTGVVEVPDENLKKLASALKIDKVVPAPVKFIDIAGLVKGAHQGEGLGNKFLSHIRETNAILHVVRDFENEKVPHISGRIDSIHDITIINLELILADFETVARRLSDKKLDTKQVEVLEKIKKILEAGKKAREARLDDEEKKIMTEFNLLTFKPMIYVINTNKEKVSQLTIELFKKVTREDEVLILSATSDGQALSELIKKAYQTLGLITFYTTKGGKEVRAWPIKKGSTAIEAAGIVHTDMARGFIKAEVISEDQLVAFKSWTEAKKAGKIRVEGKNYQIQDREVVEVRFH
jgi:small GTP-binding protein